MEHFTKGLKSKMHIGDRIAKILNFCSTGSIIGSRLYLKPPPKANLKVKLKQLYK